MFISFIHSSVSQDADEQAVIHSFYKDSFSALYGIPKDCIEEAQNTSNDWLVSALNDTLSDVGQKGEPEFFFDVRTTEDFSSPAPEYLLLHELGLKRTSPLSIKGRGSLALIQALRLAELYMGAGEQALFCLAEQYNRYDNSRSIRGHAVSFIASASSGDFLIEDFGLCSSAQELDRLIENNVFDVIYKDAETTGISGTLPVMTVSPFLTDVFVLIKNEFAHIRSFRALCLCTCGNMHGYYIIGKDNGLL